jgi:hypothetical protein
MAAANKTKPKWTARILNPAFHRSVFIAVYTVMSSYQRRATFVIRVKTKQLRRATTSLNLHYSDGTNARVKQDNAAARSRECWLTIPIFTFVSSFCSFCSQ